MYIAITDNRSGETELLRRLAPNESIDPETHARKWVSSFGETIAERTGHIPRGYADFYAETRDTKEPSGSCWQSFDFYLSDSEPAE